MLERYPGATQAASSLSERLFMKFTNKSIEKIKPQAERFEVWETNGKGFGLRVSPAGKKSWVYLYRYDGRPRRMTFGEYPKMGLADAHEAHAKAKKDLSKGIDPGEKDQAKKTAHRDAFTVADLVDEYMKRYAKSEKVTWREDLRCLKKDVLPAIGRKKAKDIKGRQIIEITNAIKDRGSPAMANRTMNVLTKLFSFAVKEAILETSPCVGRGLPATKGKRDRALDDAEIRVFWNGLDKTEMEGQYQLALKFLLTTLQRRGELMGAKWEEFNLDTRLWEIPIERLKSRMKREDVVPHLVPLSRLAVSLLNEIRELSGDSEFLFPSHKKAGQPVDPSGVTKALRKVMDEDNEDRIDVEYFTAHDLRRSGTTGMTRIGISRFMAGKVLNHAESGVTGQVYDKYDYLEEKKDALERWGRKLEAIISGKKAKVIELKK